MLGMPEKECVVEFRNEATNHAAIVFIHGFTGHCQETWREFPDLIKKDTTLARWDIYSFGYNGTSLFPGIRGIYKSAAPLTTLANLFRTTMSHGRFEQYGELAVVSHSMGGLILQRAILDDQILRQRLRFAFLFGTPNNGAKVPWFLSLFHKQLSDMSENSEFITGLRSNWNEQFGQEHSFELVVVDAEQDEWVWHPSHDVFPHAEKYVVPGDHVSMVKPTGFDDESGVG